MFDWINPIEMQSIVLPFFYDFHCNNKLRELLLEFYHIFGPEYELQSSNRFDRYKEVTHLQLFCNSFVFFELDVDGISTW